MTKQVVGLFFLIVTFSSFVSLAAQQDICFDSDGIANMSFIDNDLFDSQVKSNSFDESLITVCNKTLCVFTHANELVEHATKAMNSGEDVMRYIAQKFGLKEPLDYIVYGTVCGLGSMFGGGVPCIYALGAYAYLNGS